MERSRTGLVRVAAAGVAVPRDVPGQPRGGREAPRRVVGGRGRSDASLGGADGLRSDGGGTGLLRDRGDPAAHRQPHGRRGVLRAGSRDRLRPAAGDGPAALRAGRRRRGAPSAPALRDRGQGEPAPACSAARRARGRRDRGAGPRRRDRGGGRLWRRSPRTLPPRSWRRWPRRRPAPCSSPVGTRRPPSNASADAARCGGTSDSPTRRHGRACSTVSRSERRETRTTAMLELRSAVAAFDRLGAVPDRDATAAFLAGEHRPPRVA